MPNHNRRPKLQSQIDHLERKHRELSQRVEELDSHMHLTPSEQVQVATLKKRKLAAKDELSHLRSSV
ncbi:MAG: YdcH family protein [Myxococcales bacterium]|jgi:hypothetical protein